MKNAGRKALEMLRKGWAWLRLASGDAAYENYVRREECSLRGAGDVPLLSREQFYLDALQRRYNSISRCC